MSCLGTLAYFAPGSRKKRAALLQKISAFSRLRKSAELIVSTAIPIASGQAI